MLIIRVKLKFISRYKTTTNHYCEFISRSRYLFFIELIKLELQKVYEVLNKSHQGNPHCDVFSAVVPSSGSCLSSHWSSVEMGVVSDGLLSEQGTEAGSVSGVSPS